MKNIKEDIKNILPDPNSSGYMNAKVQSPYAILLEFKTAINEKYNKKIVARVTESYKLINSETGEDKENIVFAFYLQAPIGKGYLYRLLEVEQIKNDLYPVKVKVFQKYTTSLGKAKYEDYESFYTDLFKFFKSSFVSTLILNLLGQVDLYNEYRNEK